MNIEQELASLRASSQAEWDLVLPNLLEQTKSLAARMKREGVLIEYVKDQDHLYITLGQEREAVAFFAGFLTVLADPKTLDIVSLEINDFTEAVKTDAFADLYELWESLLSEPILRFLPYARDEEAHFPQMVAQDVHQMLAVASAG